MTDTPLDLALLQQWKGRTEAHDDVIRPDMAAALAATLDRPAPQPDAPAPAPKMAAAEAAWSRTVIPDPVLLFRYSALTFNGHRIHYDRSYVTEVEGYLTTVNTAGTAKGKGVSYSTCRQIDRARWMRRNASTGNTYRAISGLAFRRARRVRRGENIFFNSLYIMTRPLDGITVITLEHAIAAPFCTRQLADLGARVIKIERPVLLRAQRIVRQREVP